MASGSGSQNRRIVWFGDTRIESKDNEERIRLYQARIQEIETCEIGILWVSDDQLETRTLSEFSFALAKGKPVLMADARSSINDYSIFLMRSAQHYCGCVGRDDALAIAAAIARNPTGDKVSVAFGGDLLRVLRKTQSPMEERLALHLVTACDLYPKVEAQVDIQAGGNRYRADFVISDPDVAVHVVVEVDGHDYHERTKEQARRDRSRDRLMMASGYHVLRFTGSEVWADPARCANEAAEFANQKISEAPGE